MLSASNLTLRTFSQVKPTSSPEIAPSCIKPQEETTLSILPHFAKLTSLGGTRSNGPILAEEKMVYVSKKEVILKDKPVQQPDYNTHSKTVSLTSCHNTKDAAGARTKEDTMETSISQGNQGFTEQPSMQERVSDVRASPWMDKEDSFGLKPVW